MSVQTFEPPQSIAEVVAATLFRRLLQWLLKPVFSPRFSVSFQRRWMRALSLLTVAPRGVIFAAGQVSGLQGEWARPQPATRRRGTLLYLHGGAYCVCSPATHRVITGRLARETGCAVFALDYLLAPEHPFPAAVEDAVAAFLALAAKGPVVLAGDSAGGGLAAAAALALRDRGQAGPAALVLLSPWVDLTLADLPPRPPPGEAMLSRAMAAHGAALYLRGAAAGQPWASPLKADLRGLAPTLIQAGTDELLHGEALRFHAALEAAGVEVRCEITPRRWHVFQLQGGALPSANQALERAGNFAAAALDRATAGAAAAEPEKIHQVVILGAGMSGLCMGIGLKRAGVEDFVILEKSTGLGGTWWDNRYPGAHVDVPAPLYSFSFEPNPRWQRRFASAAEILGYQSHCAERYGLTSHLRLGQRLREAAFDDSTGLWNISLEGGGRLRARCFVCSTGPLSQPRLPDLPGIDAFRGQVLHSARWDREANFAGQRVAVIGTGSSAAQLVAPIAAQARTLHVFQRTANWVLPRLDRRYNALDRALATRPLYARVVRRFWYYVLEFFRRGFDDRTLARKLMLALARGHLRRLVPDPALRARLQPGYPLGCKRLLYSNDFYPALTRPNVELVTEGIERLTAQGIVTKDGRERPIDALVCATGFETVNLLSSLEIRGPGGRTLREAWKDGPEAYHGITVSGFPNLFLLLGPNTGTGHTSTLLFIEPQVDYVIACLRQLEGSGRRWLDLRPEVLAAHNQALQARLQGSVWSQCRSWYRTESGKVVALFPGFTSEYVESIARPDFSEYRFG
ncbi:MAG: hypothetical protein NVS4B10_10720 [Myxococcales bacterium]